MREVWMPVLGYEGYYEASNLGKIRREGGNVLKPTDGGRGYLYVTLSVGNVQKTVRLHREVLSAFCGPPPFDGAHAAHNDGCPSNCALTNLRWATNLENQADVDRHGRRPKGTGQPQAVLNDDIVRSIRMRIENGETQSSIAKEYCVHKSLISLINTRKKWRHVE